MLESNLNLTALQEQKIKKMSRGKNGKMCEEELILEEEEIKEKENEAIFKMERAQPNLEENRETHTKLHLGT